MILSSTVGVVPVNVFASITSKTPHLSRWATPTQIAALLQDKVQQVTAKESAKLLTFNQYRDGAEGRGIADIELAHVVCGDIDHLTNTETFEAGLSELDRWGAQVIAHQTFSHTPEAPRWRVFVFLDEPVTPDDYRQCWRGLNDVFGGTLDGAAKDASRLNYWPSCPVGQTRVIRTLNPHAQPGGRPVITPMLMARGAAKAPQLPDLTLAASAARQLALTVRTINDDVLGSPATTMVDPARALSALKAIPPPTAYDEWRDILWAYRDAGGDPDSADQWSATGANYGGPGPVRSVWDSFNPEGGMHAGTLFLRAREHAWIDPTRTRTATNSENDSEAQPTEETERATDLSIAKLFVSKFAGTFRFDHSVKGWRHYRAGSWAVCRRGEQVEAMKRLAGQLMEKAGKRMGTEGGSDAAKRLMACAQRAQSAQGIDAALRLAQSGRRQLS